jgi:hypothetical protein
VPQYQQRSRADPPGRPSWLVRADCRGRAVRPCWRAILAGGFRSGGRPGGRFLRTRRGQDRNQAGPRPRRLARAGDRRRIGLDQAGGIGQCGRQTVIWSVPAPQPAVSERLTPSEWRNYAARRTGLAAPEHVTDGAPAQFEPSESGYDPGDPVDRAIMATRNAVFPLHGLMPLLPAVPDERPDPPFDVVRCDHCPAALPPGSSQLWVRRTTAVRKFKIFTSNGRSTSSEPHTRLPIRYLSESPLVPRRGGHWHWPLRPPPPRLRHEADIGRRP